MSWKLLPPREGSRQPSVDCTAYFVLDENNQPVRATKEESRAFAASDRAKVAYTDLGDGWTVSTFFDGEVGDPDAAFLPFFVTDVIMCTTDSEEWAWVRWEHAKERHDEIAKR